MDIRLYDTWLWFTSSYSDCWYVNVDGKEGWVPCNVLRMMTDEEMDAFRDGSTNSSANSSHDSDLEDTQG